MEEEEDHESFDAHVARARAKHEVSQEDIEESDHDIKPEKPQPQLFEKPTKEEKKPEANIRTIPENGIYESDRSDGGYEEITYKNGFKNGPYKIWNRHKYLIKNMMFENDLLHGESHFFDDFGRPDVSMSYVEGKISGQGISYQPNGLIAFKAEYAHGEQHGLMQTYDQFGDLSSECDYRHDVKHGKETIYYPKNGGVCQISHYEQGQLVGIQKMFHTNGMPFQTTPYKAGCPTEYTTSVSDTGQPL